MNELINSIFGDSYITLDCEGGECLHYSQVPGYVVCYVSSFPAMLSLNCSLATPETRQYEMGGSQHCQRGFDCRSYLLA